MSSRYACDLKFIKVYLDPHSVVVHGCLYLSIGGETVVEIRSQDHVNRGFGKEAITPCLERTDLFIY